MSRQDYPYDEDEFDVLGADRTPQGVHRAPVPRWRQLLPFAVVIVLAPLLAWVGVSALSGDFGADDNDDPPAVTQPEDPEDEATDPEDEATEDDEATDPEDEATDPEDEATEPEDEATEDDEDDDNDIDEADLDRNVPVLIMNGTATVGLAGSAAEALGNEGWTNLNTADYGQAQPTVTTLYYHDATLAEEAEAVAADLGITETVESASAASQGVVIVLRDDFGG